MTVGGQGCRAQHQTIYHATSHNLSGPCLSLQQVLLTHIQRSHSQTDCVCVLQSAISCCKCSKANHASSAKTFQTGVDVRNVLLPTLEHHLCLRMRPEWSQGYKNRL